MERAEKPRAAALKQVQKSLKGVRVHAVEELITYLKYDGEKISSSESHAECFVTKVCVAGDELLCFTVTLTDCAWEFQINTFRGILFVCCIDCDK